MRRNRGYRAASRAAWSASKTSVRLGSWTTGTAAMAWAVEHGIISGTSATTLSPADASTRAQLATILMRFCADQMDI